MTREASTPIERRTWVRVSLWCGIVSILVGTAGCSDWNKAAQTGANAALQVLHWAHNDPPMPRFSPIIYKSQAAASLKGERSHSAKKSSYQPLPILSTKSIKKAKQIKAPENSEAFKKSVAAHYGKGRAFRMMIQTDKPLYKPGETIWVRSVLVRLKENQTRQVRESAVFELINPRGITIKRQKVLVTKGHCHSQFKLSKKSVGGPYTIRIKNRYSRVQFSKKITVNAYLPPRIKKKLEFIRKGYGPGDTVEATLTLRRATGELLRNHSVRMVAKLSGRTFKRWSQRTNQKGKAQISFTLPKKIKSDDGSLNVLITDAGVTESISRPIPLLVKQLNVGLFPEGGQAVIGLPSRFYFSIRRKIDQKPQDIEGVIREKSGKIVTKIRTFHDGMGRFVFTPEAGKQYALAITKPIGFEKIYVLPRAKKRGLTMRMVDDFRSKDKDLRMIVHSSHAQKVVLTGLQYETIVGHQAFSLHKGRQLLVLPLSQKWRGIVRLTLFDGNYQPLAERLIFRNRGKGLKVEILANQKSYQPRNTVHLKVRVTNPAGNPISKARLGVSVVDDTVLSFADDHEPNFLVQRYLTGQLLGSIHKPNFYFDRKEPKSWRGLDLVMGTHGWRGFSWRKVAKARKPRLLAKLSSYGYRSYKRRLRIQTRRRNWRPRRTRGRRRVRRKFRRIRRQPLRARRPKGAARVGNLFALGGGFGKKGKRKRLMKAPPPPAAVQGGLFKKLEGKADQNNIQAKQKLNKEDTGDVAIKALKDTPAPKPVLDRKAEPVIAEAPDRRMAVPKARRVPQKKRRRFRKFRRRVRWRRVRRRRRMHWAVARVFPTKFYKQDKPYTGLRTDFRDTIYWNPSVVTDAWGEAKLKFGLNDKITSFRVHVTGLGKGLLAMQDKVIASKRPFFMIVKLPVEVSAGDGLALPLTLRNDTKKALLLKVKVRMSRRFKLMENPIPNEVKLPAGEARTYFFPVRVVSRSGRGFISFRASAQGISDSFRRDIKIKPRGFPRERSWAGTLSGKKTRTFVIHLPKDIRSAAPKASLSIYPNPLSSMIKGMASMIRAPYGCFEQASSSNYPNIMVVSYLRSRRLRRSKMMRRAYAYLDQGYRKIVGYESKSRGYEWFGKSPGHEALTAYGLLQFTEMKKIYPRVSRAMISRTSKWLLSRRDGKGGYLRNSRALDTFGRADKKITDAYITFALAEAGRRGMIKELKYLQDVAFGSSDPYFLSLVLNATYKVQGRGNKTFKALTRKLLSRQREDGSFHGGKHSITRSYGRNLHIETTSLAILAMLRARVPSRKTMRALRWLRKRRSRYGGFGTTQATILALRAIIAFDKANRGAKAPGVVKLRINGTIRASHSFGKKQLKAISFKKFYRYLKPGKNVIKVHFTSTSSMPFSLGIRYFTREPVSQKRVAVSLKTTLAKTRLKMGEVVRLTATLTNKTSKGIPMTLARIAFPGALRVQMWQLKALLKKKQVDFYETGAREVIVYYRSLAPNAKKVIHLDLVARVTGNYTGSASSAYLYYTNDKKHWSQPLKLSVSP